MTQETPPESESSSVSTMKDVENTYDETINDEKPTLSNESSTNSISNQSPHTHLEPNRFPSLSFISNNNSDRQTSIKNANLKSELIENTSKTNKSSKDSLFATNSLNPVLSLASHNAGNPSLGSTNTNTYYNSTVKKFGSSTTLQTVYTDAYSNFEIDEGRSLSLYGIPGLNQNEYEDSNSVYQQSIHSSHTDTHGLNYNNMRSNQNNFNTQNNKEDTESFIYSDLNSIDIASIHDHKGQRKVSNNVMLMSNPFGKENNPILTNGLSNNEFDFLDNQSISTVVTNNDNQFFSGSRSPVNKRYSFQQNNLSVSPTHSKVRQVSQKIFQNNSNNQPCNTSFTKIKLQKRNHTHSYNDFRDLNEDIDEDIDEDINEHTGLTDAESFLAKPFKSRKNQHYKYASMNNLKLDVPYKKKTYGSINENYGDPIDRIDDFDEENTINHSSPHDYKSMYYRQNYILNFLLSLIYIFIILILLISFLKIVVVQNFDNSLGKFEVNEIANVLISDEILLLDIKSQAINSNFQDIDIWFMDLDVFLVTDESNLELKESIAAGSTDVTILLGNSNKFLTPFHYNGLLHLSKWSEVWRSWKHPETIDANKSVSQLKIYKPGRFFEFQGKKLTRDQWASILNNPYKIILRGNLKYSLPLLWQDQFISLSTEIDILPSAK